MKKKISMLLILALLVAMLAGCGSSATPAAQSTGDGTETTEGGLIGVCMQNMSSSINELEATAMKETFIPLGYDVQIASADDNVSTQVQQVQNFITMGAKVLVILPCEIETLEDTLIEAREAGIKVIVSGGTGSISEDAYDAASADDEFVIGMYVAAVTKAWVEKNMDPNGDWDVCFLASTISEDAKTRCAGERMIVEPYMINEAGEYTDIFGVVVDEANKVENPVYCQMIADRVGGNMSKHSIEMDISGDNRSVVAAALTDNPKVRVFIGYNSLISTAGSQYILDTFPENEWDEYAFFSAGVMGNEYEYLIGAVADNAGTRSVFRGAAQFGGGDAAATLVALTKAVMFGEEGVDYGKLNANSIGMYVPIAAELNNGVPALVSFDTASHIEYYTLEEILKLDNLVTYWDAANGYNPAEQSADEALPPLDAEPVAEGSRVYTCVLAGPMGDDNLQFVLNEDGTCEFSLPGNAMITDVYAGTYEQEGNVVTVKGLTNVDESSDYKIPGLWSFIDSTTGDAVIYVLSDGTFSVEPVEDSGYPLVLSCVLAGPMGDDNLQIVLNEDGTCEFSLPGNPMITDVYAGTYERDGDTVAIKGLTNVDESSEYKIPGLWSFIDSATGDAVITVDEAAGTFNPAE